MVSGGVLFGVSYLAPPLVAAAIAGLPHLGGSDQEEFRMFIPVAGPLTLLHSGGDYMWLNAILVLHTVLQSAGLAMAIIGIMRFTDSGAEPSAHQTAPRLRLMAAPLPSGGQAALRLTF